MHTPFLEGVAPVQNPDSPFNPTRDIQHRGHPEYPLIRVRVHELTWLGLRASKPAIQANFLENA